MCEWYRSGQTITSSQSYSKGRINRENTGYFDYDSGWCTYYVYNEIVTGVEERRTWCGGGGLGRRIYGHFTTSFNRSLIIVGRLHFQLPIPNSWIWIVNSEPIVCSVDTTLKRSCIANLHVTREGTEGKSLYLYIRTPLKRARAIIRLNNAIILHIHILYIYSVSTLYIYYNIDLHFYHFFNNLKWQYYRYNTCTRNITCKLS